MIHPSVTAVPSSSSYSFFALTKSQATRHLSINTTRRHTGRPHLLSQGDAVVVHLHELVLDQLQLHLRRKGHLSPAQHQRRAFTRRFRLGTHVHPEQGSDRSPAVVRCTCLELDQGCGASDRGQQQQHRRGAKRACIIYTEQIKQGNNNKKGRLEWNFTLHLRNSGAGILKVSAERTLS